MKRKHEAATQQHQVLPSHCFNVIDIHVRSKYFTDIRAFFNWYCISQAHYFILHQHRMKRNFLSLLDEKRNYLMKHAQDKLHFEYRQQYIDLTNIMKIELLKKCLETRIQASFNVFIARENNALINPRHTKLSLGPLTSVARFIGATNMMSPHVFSLLQIAFTKIKLVYGWHIMLLDNQFGLHITQPTRENHDNILIALHDSGGNPIRFWYQKNESQLTLPVMSDFIMIITKYGVEAADFTCLKTFNHWFATCRQQREYFLTNPELTPLLTLKRQQMLLQGPGKIHIWWRRNYVLIQNTLRVESLMTYFIKKMNNLFDNLIALDNDRTDPSDVSFILCHLIDLSPLLENARRLQGEYLFYLMTQCRTLIDARYGWKLFFINHLKNKHLTFPWKSSDHCDDTALSIGICADRLKFADF